MSCKRCSLELDHPSCIKTRRRRRKRNIKEQNGPLTITHWKKKKNQHVNKTVRSDVVEPVDEVEQREDGREDDPWPAVDGVHIRQIGDFDFELRGPPPQTAALQLGGPVQGVAAGRARPGSAALLAVLDVRRRHAVQLHHGLRVPNVRHAGGDLASRHFVMDLQGGEQDVPLAVRFCLNGQRNGKTN